MFVASPERYWLWAAGLLAELLTPLLSAKAIAKVPFHVSHIPERFGLFVIIVLGEAVALDALGMADSDLTNLARAVAGGGFLVAAAMWWLYFDCVDTSPMRRWLLSGQTYVYGHLVVFASITAFGVGVLLASRSVTDPALTDPARWLMCAGVGGFVFAIGVIHLVNELPRGDLRAWTRLGLGALFVLLGWVGRGLPPLALEGVLLAGVAAQTVLELRLLYAATGTHSAADAFAAQAEEPAGIGLSMAECEFPDTGSDRLSDQGSSGHTP